MDGFYEPRDAHASSEDESFASAQWSDEDDAPSVDPRDILSPAFLDQHASQAAPRSAAPLAVTPLDQHGAREGSVDELSETSSGHSFAQDPAQSPTLHAEERCDSASGLEAAREELTPEEHKARVAEAESFKASGNDHYRAGNHDAALQSFAQALDTAPHDAQERAVYHANSAACYLSLKKYKECVASCTEALEIDAAYQKALMRRMLASEALDDLENALKDAQQMLELDPGNAKMRANIAMWEPVVKERQEQMKAEMMGKLKDLGNSILGHFGMSVDNFKFEQDPNTGGYSIKMQQ